MTEHEKARPGAISSIANNMQRRERGELAGDVGCVDWLISINPFRHTSDSEHFRSGLLRAGFEV